MKLFQGIALSALILAATPARAQQRGTPTPIDPRVQQMVDAQLAAPKLDTRGVVSVDLTAATLGTVLDAIAKAAGIMLRYDPAVTNLNALSTVKLSNATADQALHGALDTQALTFKVTGTKNVFVYPDTPVNRAKYTESIRTFTIAKADIKVLGQTLNQALTGSAMTIRPVIVTDNESRTIWVRATPDAMAEIAKLIAANDK